MNTSLLQESMQLAHNVKLDLLDTVYEQQKLALREILAYLDNMAWSARAYEFHLYNQGITPRQAADLFQKEVHANLEKAFLAYARLRKPKEKPDKPSYAEALAELKAFK